MKFVRRSFDRKWSRFVHANLDHLVVLQDMFRRDPAGATRQFSASLQDVDIGGFAKYTFAARLAGTEDVLVRHVRSQGWKDVALLDLGASDGSTTVSLAGALRPAVPGALTLFLADKNLYLERYRRGPFLEYRAPGGEPVQLRIGPFAWRLPRADHRWDVLSQRLVRRYMGSHRFRRAMRPDGRIPLVTPAAAHHPAIRTLELDCTVYRPDLAGSFQAIRASNLLNAACFRAEEIREIACFLERYLAEGGLLLVSRNDEYGEKSENGALWQKRGNGFVMLEEFGKGSEIKPLVPASTGAA